MAQACPPAAWPSAIPGLLFCALMVAIVSVTPRPTGDMDFDLLGGRPAAIAAPVVPPAPPFYLHAANQAEWGRAVRCLTDAVYYEAGDEPEAGQRAVAQVVVNRLRDPHFPKSVCGVVYEGWRRRTGCQFSFVCDGSIRRRPEVPAIWDRMRPIAVQALEGYVVAEVGASTHYYADYVRPNWLGSVREVAQVGRQVFCRWRGPAGLPSALASPYGGGEFGISDVALDGGPPPVTRAVLRQVKRRRLAPLRIALEDDRRRRA
jgi:hypothetical protein